MLDISFIRENPGKVKEGIKKIGYDPKVVDRVLRVDEARRQLIGEIERFRQKRNKLTKDDIKQGKKIKEMLKRLEPDLRAVEEQLKNLLYEIPNLPAAYRIPTSPRSQYPSFGLPRHQRLLPTAVY